MRGIMDMHCDTLSYLEAEREKGSSQTLRQNAGQLDLLRMKESGYLLQNFAVYVDVREHPGAWERAMRLIACFQEQMRENADLIRQVSCFREIEQNQREGKLSALLTVEEGGICAGEKERLRELYALGVRMMTLTWNYPNELGAPAVLPEDLTEEERQRFSERTPHGLTETGREFVWEMERLGILPDVSHLSDEGFWELLEMTKKPIVASHSNARSLCAHGRNLTDGMIRAIGERGGVIGLNFYTKFLIPAAKAQRAAGADCPARSREEFPGRLAEHAISREEFLDHLAEHARRIMQVGGEDVLGLGSDFDGIPANPLFPGAQSVGSLWEELQKRGFRERELDKIFAENVLRVYREVLKE